MQRGVSSISVECEGCNAPARVVCRKKNTAGQPGSVFPPFDLTHLVANRHDSVLDQAASFSLSALRTFSGVAGMDVIQIPTASWIAFTMAGAWAFADISPMALAP